MTRVIGVLLLAVFLLLFSACEKKEEGEVVARVNDETLTVKELEELIPAEYFFQMSKEHKGEAVKNWIETELLYQEALGKEIHKEERIELMIKDAQRQILVNELLTREIGVRMEPVTEKDVESYFNLYKEGFNATVKIARIFVLTEEEAREILESLKKGESFSELAKEKSQDKETAEKGGVLGYVKWGDGKLSPALEEVAFALKRRGELSGVVRSDYGYYILKLLHRSPLEKKVTLDDVADRIRWLLSMDKQKKALSAVLSELREKADIEENYDILR